MNKSSMKKVLLTIAAVAVFILFFALISASRQLSGASTPGMLGTICLAFLIVALYFIWKKDKSNNDNNVEDKE